MKVETSLFDIVKSIVLLSLVVFTFIHTPKMFNDYIVTNNKVDETIIANIARNVSVATIAESNKDVKVLIKLMTEQNSVALEAIKASNERIDELGQITATMSGKVDWLSNYDKFTDTEGGTRDLEEVIVKFDATDGNKYPVATVRLSPNIEGEERWSIEPHDLQFKTNIIETTDDDGNPKRYAEAWVENHWSTLGKEADGSYTKFPVDLKITNWAKRVDKDKKFWYNPRLGFTGIASDTMAVGLHLGLFSYGTTKADSDWQFMSFGLAASNDTELAFFTPVKYNIGKPLPLMDNLFIGPTGYLDSDSDYNFGISISTLF